MNCNIVRNLLSAYADSELSGTQMLAIRSHLKTCQECHSELEGIKAIKSGLAQLHDHVPTGSMPLAIIARVTKQEAIAPVSRTTVLTLAAAAAGAAFLAIIVFNAAASKVDRAKMASDPNGFDSQADQAVTTPDFGGHAPIIPVSK